MTDFDFHGTAGGYTNHGCRCEPCKTAGTQAHREQYARRRARLESGAASVRHGSSSTYTNWGCRCVECRAANAAKSSRYRAARR